MKLRNCSLASRIFISSLACISTHSYASEIIIFPPVDEQMSIYRYGIEISIPSADVKGLAARHRDACDENVNGRCQILSFQIKDRDRQKSDLYQQPNHFKMSILSSDVDRFSKELVNLSPENSTIKFNKREKYHLSGQKIFSKELELEGIVHLEQKMTSRLSMASSDERTAINEYLSKLSRQKRTVKSQLTDFRRNMEYSEIYVSYNPVSVAQRREAEASHRQLSKIKEVTALGFFAGLGALSILAPFGIIFLIIRSKRRKANKLNAS